LFAPRSPFPLLLLKTHFAVRPLGKSATLSQILLNGLFSPQISSSPFFRTQEARVRHEFLLFFFPSCVSSGLVKLRIFFIGESFFRFSNPKSRFSPPPPWPPQDSWFAPFFQPEGIIDFNLVYSPCLDDFSPYDRLEILSSPPLTPLFD